MWFFKDNLLCMLYAFISMQLNTDFVNWWDINVEKENKLVILNYYYFVNCIIYYLLIIIIL